MRRLGILALFLAACTDTRIEEEQLPVADPAVFSPNLQLYVGYRCGSLDCHGDMGRALRIYALDGLRQSDRLRGQGIALSELEENALSFGAFAFDARFPDENLVLLKALTVEAGGMAHEGDPIWVDRQDPGYLCLSSWARGEATNESCRVASDMVIPDEN